MRQLEAKAALAAQESIREGCKVMETKDTVNNKTTISYKSMISSKKLDSFFSEEDKEEA
jgi:hypothetical protein